MARQKNVETVVPLKHRSNFWRALDMPLINCEVSLTLTWSLNCELTSKATRDANPDVDPAVVEINNPTNSSFPIIETKLCIPVVTLSTQDDNKLLQQQKTGYKKTIKWNKYRSDISSQTKNSNLNYFIDPRFKVNRLFVQSTKIICSKYCMPTVEIKDYNVLVHGKSFDVSIKSKEETYEKIIEMRKNNDYPTGNLLDYENFSNHYKLIATDLSKQMELQNADTMQQINFIGRLEDEATMFFIIKK